MRGHDGQPKAGGTFRNTRISDWRDEKPVIPHRFRDGNRACTVSDDDRDDGGEIGVVTGVVTEIRQSRYDSGCDKPRPDDQFSVHRPAAFPVVSHCV